MNAWTSNLAASDDSERINGRNCRSTHGTHMRRHRQVTVDNDTHVTRAVARSY